MKYLIGFLSEESVKTRTYEVAHVQGCTDNITEFWFGWIEHPARVEFGLIVPENEQFRLTDEEQAALKTYSELEADGWFEVP